MENFASLPHRAKGSGFTCSGSVCQQETENLYNLPASLPAHILVIVCG